MHRKRAYNLHLIDPGIPLTKYARAKRKERLDQHDAERDLTPLSSRESPQQDRISANEHDGRTREENVDTDFHQESSELNEAAGFEELRKEMHDNTEMSMGDLIVLVLAYGKRYGLSRSATLDLFRLMKTVLRDPVKDMFPDTWHKFDRLMEDHIAAYDVHYYCPEHLCYLGTGGEFYVCPVDHAEIYTKENPDAYFIVLPLKDSIFLTLESFADVWEKHMGNLDFQQQKKPGRLHESIRNHFNLTPTDFTITLHSDGAWLRKTKWADGRSCHMVQLTINELPVSFRDRNILLSSVYCGKHAVPLHVLLTPLMKELNRLMTHEPLVWYLNGKRTVSRIFCDRIACDSAERYKLVNMRSHQAYFGCTTCRQKGCVCGSVHVFEHIAHLEIRDHEETVKTGQTAAAWDQYEQDKMEAVLKGVVGPSPFSQLCLPTVNLTRSFPGDYYHLFVEGIMSALLRIWLRDGNLNVRQADILLARIRPNLQAKRLPRSIADCHKRYQGHELLFLLLFYGFPIFRNALPEEMYAHYCRLSYVAHIALMEKMTERAIEVVDEELTRFSLEFENLYGRREMSYNVHQLRHFAMNLEDWGPAPEFWTFQFESALGYRTRRVHGTQHTAKEIARTSALDLAVTVLQKKVRSTSRTTNEALDLLQNFSNPQRTRRGFVVPRKGKLGAPVCLQGCVRKSNDFKKLHPDLYGIMSDTDLFGNPDRLRFAFRCVVEKGFTCAADKNFEQQRRTLSYTFLRSGRLLKVQYFFAVGPAETAQTFAVGELFDVAPYRFSETFGMDFRFIFSIEQSLGTGCAKTVDMEFSALEVINEQHLKVFIKTPNCLSFDI